ncbi:uncharacterized membrane protein YsdA (DUF1294 family) [Bacillus ectoiniformans]|uniref:DUF1294 domain-containing protein n=1 Tax=Bacillus ectoiniformans TaxID=1494429 RepID=UPI00195665C1|nr:DUF1294 domain-containing protein [Bacillus ectoiniformans]MBM7648867.1 uncharacterized membrane protein YsdA (DUF1294 family) [Bacillus ectoiniformans]
MLSWLFGYFVLINLFTYMVMGQDKRKAQRGQYRTSEQMLWLLALAGGACGGWLAMQTYRHKTKHTAFVIGMPLLAIIDLGLLSLLSA